MGLGSDADLPQDLLSVLPPDPYDQLDIARKITSLAVTSRVEILEKESRTLHQQLAEKEGLISGLQERVGELQQALQQSTARLFTALDEQAKLTNEKSALTASVKKLNRDVAKLEAFKRTLMQSLRDDGETQSQAVDDKHSADLHSAADSSFPSLSSLKALRNNTHQVFPLTPPNVTPELTPSGSPTRRHSTVTLPRGRSEAVSPKGQSTRGSPKWHSIGGGRFSLPSSLPTSQHSTAPNSPPHAGSHTARAARVDAKEFFRQARNCLSYEQFSAFLANIKELNAHKQTREETLMKANGIFGPDNKDLYVAFDGLLSRHLPRQG